jgi:hypothetical protein
MRRLHPKTLICIQNPNFHLLRCKKKADPVAQASLTEEELDRSDRTSDRVTDGDIPVLQDSISLPGGTSKSEKIAKALQIKAHEFSTQIRHSPNMHIKQTIEFNVRHPTEST